MGLVGHKTLGCIKRIRLCLLSIAGKHFTRCVLAAPIVVVVVVVTTLRKSTPKILPYRVQFLSLVNPFFLQKIDLRKLKAPFGCARSIAHNSRTQLTTIRDNCSAERETSAMAASLSVVLRNWSRSSSVVWPILSRDLSRASKYSGSLLMSSAKKDDGYFLTHL